MLSIAVKLADFSIIYSYKLSHFRKAMPVSWNEQNLSNKKICMPLDPYMKFVFVRYLHSAKL